MKNDSCFTGFIAVLRNPWKCLNMVLKIQSPGNYCVQN